MTTFYLRECISEVIRNARPIKPKFLDAHAPRSSVPQHSIDALKDALAQAVMDDRVEEAVRTALRRAKEEA